MSPVKGNLTVLSGIVTQEAIAHRLGQLAKQLRTLEQKYGMSFTQFDTQLQAGKIPSSTAMKSSRTTWSGKGYSADSDDCRKLQIGSVDGTRDISPHP
jgi:hypothetical protein